MIIGGLDWEASKAMLEAAMDPDEPVPLVLRPHQIDPTKGGCLVCGIDSGSIERSLPLCTGPLSYKSTIHVEPARAGTLDTPSAIAGNNSYGGLVAGPLHVPRPPKPIQWHPNMQSQELKSVDRLVAEKAKLEAEIAKRVAEEATDPANVKKIHSLPPRTVD